MPAHGIREGDLEQIVVFCEQALHDVGQIWKDDEPYQIGKI